jgi:hypothetical protein
MDTPKLALDRRWIEQELSPYLRCAFSHDLSYDKDITPIVCRALDFCMHKAVCCMVHVQTRDMTDKDIGPCK